MTVMEKHENNEMPSRSLLLTLSMLGNVYIRIAGTSTSNCCDYIVHTNSRTECRVNMVYIKLTPERT